MDNLFLFDQFLKRFPNDDFCLEEIKRLKYPNGVFCTDCNKKTIHYRVKNRTSYVCKDCRTQISPLTGTIFEKTTTPLRIWFYAIFLMTQTQAEISIKQLQNELGVTYKTAWRIYKNIKQLMEQNNGDLLTKVEEKVRRWTFFDKIEISLVEKKESSS